MTTTAVPSKQHLPPEQYAAFQARQSEVGQHLQFVASVADMLGETKPYPRWQLHLIVRKLGAPRVVAMGLL